MLKISKLFNKNLIVVVSLLILILLQVYISHVCSLTPRRLVIKISIVMVTVVASVPFVLRGVFVMLYRCITRNIEAKKIDTIKKLEGP